MSEKIAEAKRYELRPRSERDSAALATANAEEAYHAAVQLSREIPGVPHFIVDTGPKVGTYYETCYALDGTLYTRDGRTQFAIEDVFGSDAPRAQLVIRGA